MVGSHLMYEEHIDGEMNVYSLMAAIFGGKSAETSLTEWGLEPVPQSIQDRNIDIMRMRRQGMTYQQIGDMYGVTKHAVYRVCKRGGMICGKH